MGVAAPCGVDEIARAAVLKRSPETARQGRQAVVKPRTLARHTCRPGAPRRRRGKSVRVLEAAGQPPEGQESKAGGSAGGARTECAAQAPSQVIQRPIDTKQ